MKIIAILCLSALCLASCGFTKRQNYQKTDSFETLAKQFEEKRHQLWEKKEYAEAIDLMKDLYSNYLLLDTKQKAKYTNGMSSLYYNISCGYALLHQNDSALSYLQKAVDSGYSNRSWVMKDSDLNNIRNEPKYLAIIEQLKKLENFEDILKKARTYEPEALRIPEFCYQPVYAENLVQLKTKYNLDSIAGNGDEVSRIIKLMQWVHQIVKHDGQSKNPGVRSADGLIEVCKREKRGVNCRMMATILNEVYLAMDFKSQFVTCLPKSKTDTDCHVINHVFSKTLNKWLWMDPTFEAWVTDEKGNLLSIPEVRERLINDLPVIAPATMNWNGKPSDRDNYLHNYMAKNLFQISIPKVSSSAYESRNGKDRTYVQLIAREYQTENVALKGISNDVYFTTDSNQFWANPK